MSDKGTLYIVATPIGNLGDLSKRAADTLQSVDYVLAEDTRITKKILDPERLYGRVTREGGPPKRALGELGEERGRTLQELRRVKIISFHQHSSEDKIKKIIEELEAGKNYALVTDAGTPGVSDPGGKLVEAAHRAGITVVPIPGPNAAVTCLSASGFPADEFTFLGFPPHKKGRETWFKRLNLFGGSTSHTIVFYESPHRILKTITKLSELYPDAEVCVCRELTKKFEEIRRGKPGELLDTRPQGEFTIALRIKN